MSKRPFTHEAQLRGWISLHNDYVLWIENKSGGTFGAPDVICARNGSALFLELKVAFKGGPTGRYIEAAPAQLQLWRSTVKAGLKFAVVAAIEGTTAIGALVGEGVLKHVRRCSKAPRLIAHRQRFLVEDWDVCFDSSQGMKPLLEQLEIHQN